MLHAFLVAWVGATVVLTSLLAAVVVVQRLAHLARRVHPAAAERAPLDPAPLEPAPFEPMPRPEIARIA